jgi:hypothetical protein
VIGEAGMIRSGYKVPEASDGGALLASWTSFVPYTQNQYSARADNANVSNVPASIRWREKFRNDKAPTPIYDMPLLLQADFDNSALHEC